MVVVSQSFAQDGAGMFESSAEDSTVRSVHVNVKDTIGKPDWCSYAIDLNTNDFMDDLKRTAFLEDSFRFGGRGFSCGWISTCKKGWDHAEYYYEYFLRAAKQVEIIQADDLRDEVLVYNSQAIKEKKPLKTVPKGLQQLHGNTDKVIYLQVPLDIFATVMKYNCNRHFDRSK